MSDRNVAPEGDGDGALLTPAELAVKWRCSTRTIQRYIKQGRLRADRLPGGSARIKRSEADKALQRVPLAERFADAELAGSQPCAADSPLAEGGCPR